jgi:ribA/ribD-fused uncharacterized protein
MIPLYQDGIYGFQGEYRFLSNFWPATIPYMGFLFPSVEHAYQAAKSFDKDYKRLIRYTSSPFQAKKLGRTAVLRDDWEEVKVLKMEQFLRLKFIDRELKKMLLDTGDKYLEETNTWNDTFWGVCNGKGQNVLGNLLMRIRKELMSG